MSAPTCPCCGRALPKAKAVDTSTPQPEWTDKQVYAYYKRTAPASDLAFLRRHASPELQAQIDAIVNPTPKDAARMRERRRIELAEADFDLRRRTVEPPTQYLDFDLDNYSRHHNWHHIPAAEFEVKFARIAAAWNSETVDESEAA